MEELRDVGHDTALVRAPRRADVLHVQQLLQAQGRKGTKRALSSSNTSNMRRTQEELKKKKKKNSRECRDAPPRPRTPW